MTFDEYKDIWSKRTKKQIEKELKSMQAYVNKHGASYWWHGSGITPPGSISDGDKISALKELLETYFT